MRDAFNKQHFRVNMRNTFLTGALTLLLSAPAMAQFVNGDFETGTTAGWTTGTGSREWTYNSELNPSAFLPGGASFNASLQHSSVVGAGIADHTDGKLNQVYSGKYSFRAEDETNGGYASAITQTVKNYQSKDVFFAWAAVLEGAHGAEDAAIFKLVLTDLTTGANLISRSFNAASTGGGVDSRFTESTDGYYYTSWQVEQLTLDAGSLGHDLSLTLLAADCEPTGHQGTVYLDGFGAVLPPPVTAVPEPETYALMLMGLAAMGAVARRRRAQPRVD